MAGFGSTSYRPKVSIAVGDARVALHAPLQGEVGTQTCVAQRLRLQIPHGSNHSGPRAPAGPQLFRTRQAGLGHGGTVLGGPRPGVKPRPGVHCYEEASLGQVGAICNVITSKFQRRHHASHTCTTRRTPSSIFLTSRPQNPTHR